MKEFEYIIIGGGLAGTILGDFLSVKSSVLIFDKEAGAYGSKVAAGICNPVTGRRMVKSWNVDSFAPFALKYYRKKEAELGLDLVNKIDIQRLFNNKQHSDEWLNRVDFDQLQEIIENQIEPDAENSALFKEFGGVTTTKSWRLDTGKYLDAMHSTFLRKGAITKKSVDYKQIQISDDEVRLNGVYGKKLIFCEGWYVRDNPWFSYLPIRPNKGELLTIKAHGLNVKDLIQKRVFVLPIGNDTFKVGATYNRKSQNYQPTTEAKTWLLERLEMVIKVPYQIIDQRVGIRPATIDRRPFIGQHLKYRNLYIFNGFGSKGVHQMPFNANHFVDFLENGAALNSEVDIKRFNKEQ